MINCSRAGTGRGRIGFTISSTAPERSGRDGVLVTALLMIETLCPLDVDIRLLHSNIVR